MTVDLHSHSRRSDGALEPDALVAAAAEVGVTTLALTDHDTLAGLDAAVAAGGRLGVRVIPGIELSVRVATGTFHLLGYLPEPEPPALVARMDEIGGRREERNREIVARLGKLGAPLAWKDVAGRATHRVGRPHIADALVAAGHAADRQDAFARFLAEGRPAYVPAGSLDPAAAIGLLRLAGAATSLAHPATLRLDEEALEGLLARLAGVGLDAVEAHRGDQPPEEQERLRVLAARHGLLVSGGSDFHRPEPADPERLLGRSGRPGLDPQAAEELLARRRSG